MISPKPETPKIDHDNSQTGPWFYHIFEILGNSKITKKKKKT